MRSRPSPPRSSAGSKPPNRALMYCVQCPPLVTSPSLMKSIPARTWKSQTATTACRKRSLSTAAFAQTSSGAGRTNVSRENLFRAPSHLSSPLLNTQKDQPTVSLTVRNAAVESTRPTHGSGPAYAKSDVNSFVMF